MNSNLLPTKYRLVLLLFILFGGCSNISEKNPLEPKNEENKTSEITYTSVIESIIGPDGSAGCRIQCHDGTLGIKNGWTYNAMVNIPSTTGMDLISPTDTTNSYLYLKIKGSEGIEGERMPFGNMTYFDEQPDELHLIRDWILKGAPEE